MTQTLFQENHFLLDDGCKTKSGWTLHDSYISTGLGHADDAELLMYIIVPGFTSHKSKFRMTYKIICPSNNCRLRVQSVSKNIFF